MGYTASDRVYCGVDTQMVCELMTAQEKVCKQQKEVCKHYVSKYQQLKHANDLLNILTYKEEIGGPTGTRTPDKRIMSPLL